MMGWAIIAVQKVIREKQIQYYRQGVADKRSGLPPNPPQDEPYKKSYMNGYNNN